MNISGLPASPHDIGAARADQRGTRAASEGSVPTTTRAADTPAARATRSASRNTPGALPANAPEGTDPALWSVLTNEERAFFSRSVTSGPLTYSRIMLANQPASPALPASRGGRVDVRV